MNQDNQSQIILYQTEDNQTQIDVRLEDETVWLTQSQMGELFQKSTKTISEHIRNIYKEGELERKATVWKFQIVQQEGQRQVARNVEHYNLDVIISVGYRVKSHRGTQFRIWATQRLREYPEKRAETAVCPTTTTNLSCVNVRGYSLTAVKTPPNPMPEKRAETAVCPASTTNL